jgi:hypothetical protein
MHKILPRGLKPYQGEVDEKLFKSLVMFGKKIAIELQRKFRQLDSKFYTDDYPTKYIMVDFQKDPPPSRLVISGIFRLEWNLWDPVRTKASENSACSELSRIVDELFKHLITKLHLETGNSTRTSQDDNVLLVKDNQVILSVGSSWEDKNECEDIQFWINLYGSNIEKYDNVDIERYGFKDQGFKVEEGVANMETYLDIIVESILHEAGFEKMPHGWNRGSVKKFGTTVGKGYHGQKSLKPTDKGYFERCVERLRGKVKNPEGLCASVKDEAHGSTMWRGKGKTQKQAMRMSAQKQNV